jgi:predicted PurR-regulated permease PerM
MKPPPLPRNESGLDQPLVWLGVISGTLLALFVCDQIWWVSIPTVLSIVLYYLCVPFVDSLKRRGLTQGQALAIFLAAATLAAIVAALVLLPWIATQLLALRDGMPAYLNEFERLLESTLTHLQRQFPSLIQPNAAELVSARLAEAKTRLIQDHIQGLVVHFLTWIVCLLLIPYLTFFMLKDGPAFKRLVMRGVPNAFFEKILLLFDRMDSQIKAYFRGLMAMTALDTVTLGLGLWLLGLAHGMFPFGQAMLLGLVAAVLSWIPYVGTASACLLILGICLVFAPGNLALAGGTVVLFIFVRLIDDFIYTPMTIGRSLAVHPLVTVMIVFCGGMIGGITGLLLAMPMLGLAMVLGDIFGRVWFDPRLRARHAHARALRALEARRGLDHA